MLTFPDWPVRYVEQPAGPRARRPTCTSCRIARPPPLDAPPVVDYFAPPGADDSTIKLNHVVHHGSLGHHVQNWHAARAESRIGRIAAVDCASRIAMLCGGTLAEGWACYATDLADELGFLTPAERYAQHRARLRMAARAVVDIRLHHGRFTLGGGGRLLRRAGRHDRRRGARRSGQEQPVSRRRVHVPGWLGRHLAAAPRWSPRQLRLHLREFHDRLLSFGSVPVALIARAMLESRPSSAAHHT